MSKNRKKLLLPTIILGFLETFCIVMMIVFWGKYAHPIGVIAFFIILTIFFVVSIYYFINPDKFYSDDKRKVRATLFNTNVDVDDDGASEEYINACVLIKMLVDFKSIYSVGEGHRCQSQTCDRRIV